jgi:DNA replication protein DnaC
MEVFVSDLILKQILKEYEQKKFIAEKEYSEKINKFYNNHRDIYDLNEQINHIALQITKSILSNTKENTTNLKINFEKLNKQKNLKLSNLNLPDDFFIPNYECKLCNDTGYIFEHNKSILCNCIKQKLFNIKYNSSNIGDLEKENFSKFNSNLYSDEINKDEYKATISPRKNIENIKNISLKFIENFEKEDQKNLLFIGNTGLGKTFLSNCIAYELLKKGKTILYQSSNTMLDSIIDYKFGKDNTSENIYNNILNADLLIIDDLGTENINTLKFAELFNIINTRLLNQNKHITKTIISTNLNIDNLFKNYDERIVSRLVGYYDICRFFGDDIRFKKH